MLANGNQGDLHGVRPLSLMMPFEAQGAAESACEAGTTALRFKPGNLGLGEVVAGCNHDDGADLRAAVGQPQFPAPDRNDARSALQTTLQRFVLDGFRAEDGALKGCCSRKISRAQIYRLGV